MNSRYMPPTMIDARLVALGDMALVRRQAKLDGLLGPAAKERYIRIASGGYRPVSVADLNPCGALQLDGCELASMRDLQQAYQMATNERVTIDAPKNGKPEHRVQAHLIRHILTAPSQAPKTLACDDIFDELRLVTDEFAIDNLVRADLLLLGRKKGSTYVPVFAELKALRAATELTSQLTNIRSLSLGKGEVFRASLRGESEESTSTSRREAFESFLQAAIGPNVPIDLDSAECLAIWPCRGETRVPEHSSVTTMRAQNIRIVGFDAQLVFRRE